MLPVITSNNLPDRSLTDAVLGGYIALPSFTFHVARANFSNLLFSKFGCALALAFRYSSALSRIAGVLSHRADKQVIGAHAGANVALMTDDLTFRHWAVMKLIGEDVRSDTSFALMLVGQCAIVSGVRAVPEPARIPFSFDDVFPESLFKCPRKTVVSALLTTKHTPARVYSGLSCLEGASTEKAFNGQFFMGLVFVMAIFAAKFPLALTNSRQDFRYRLAALLAGRCDASGRLPFDCAFSAAKLPSAAGAVGRAVVKHHFFSAVITRLDYFHVSPFIDVG